MQQARIQFFLLHTLWPAGTGSSSLQWKIGLPNHWRGVKERTSTSLVATKFHRIRQAWAADRRSGQADIADHTVGLISQPQWPNGHLGLDGKHRRRYCTASSWSSLRRSLLRPSLPSAELHRWTWWPDPLLNGWSVPNPSSSSPSLSLSVHTITTRETKRERKS